MTDFKKILKLVDKLVDLEGTIEKEIKKEASASWRKKLREAVRHRDTSRIRDMWFNPDK